jgi:hypothetical protein
MTTTQNIYNMTDTWTDGSTYTAIKMNVTDTSSNAASLLADLQVGGTSKITISKGGVVRISPTSGGATQNLILESGQAFLSAVQIASGGAIAFSDGVSFSGGLLQNSSGILESNSGGAVGTGGIIPGVRIATTQVVTSLLNNNTNPQNVFASANDVLTLVASTTYFFDCLYFINTGGTSHTTATGFVASSAFTSINYLAELWSTTAGTISTTAPSVLDVGVSTATVLNATSTATRTTIRCNGIIRTNGATTVTPQITFSAGPTGTCEVAVNSYFRIWPVGSNTVAAVGSWA